MLVQCTCRGIIVKGLSLAYATVSNLLFTSLMHTSLCLQVHIPFLENVKLAFILPPVYMNTSGLLTFQS